jgi:hypothetical protein
MGDYLLVTLELIDPSETFLILTTWNITLVQLLMLLQMSSIYLNDQNLWPREVEDEFSMVLT